VRREIAVPAETTGPLVAPASRTPAPGAAQWRRRWADAVPGRDAVLLSAGAWGAASHLADTARLLAGHGYLPVVLCGRDERLRARLAGLPQAVALGWVEDVPGLMGAARALVDNAAGQTAVQALAAGLPVVGFRPLPGHGEDGVRRMAALGAVEFAPDDSALLASLDRLTPDGPARAARIEQGRAVFRSDPLASLTRLAGNRAS
jgi:hypothetical protein